MPMLLLLVFLACLENNQKIYNSNQELSTKTTQQNQLQLEEAWSKRDPSYVPRTKHINPDGSPKYINQLFLESSPYLKQHAHNPVDWRPWNKETLVEAQHSNKMIFLSVGYSTCHWCHVMEEESFEDEEIAQYINEHYIPIKVDREERPDVDAIYMKAVTLLRGRGGWPMSVWLTPDGDPIYAATYIPARTGDRGSRKGFLETLQEIQQTYQENPNDITKEAEGLRDRIIANMKPLLPGNIDPEELIALALAQTQMEFDPLEGGRKGQPKFPSSLAIPFLLQQSQYGNKQAQMMAKETLFKMASGGIYDHIGGGFHRYSVDSKWRIPHFEKMLYDNAQLAVDYRRAEQLFPQQGFGEISQDILNYLLREMQADNGGFYSATDADSLTPSGHREEGYYFSWTPSEVTQLLGDKATQVAKQFNVTKQGNFEGRTVLYASEPISLWLAKDSIHAQWRDSLYQQRQQRPAPLRDNKILTAWNGLALSAFAQAAHQFQSPQYLEAAIQIVDCIELNLVLEKKLYRSYAEGKTQHLAYIEDYAFYISGLLDLFEASQNPRYLSLAMKWDTQVQQAYEDPAGGWYRNNKEANPLMVREMPSQDKAEPSGASYMLRNLLRLMAFTGLDSYRQRADNSLARYSRALQRYPLSLDDMLIAIDWKLHPPQEMIIAVQQQRDAQPFLEIIDQHPHNHILVVLHQDNREELSRLLPSTINKTLKEGKPTIYICQNGVCQFPINTIDGLVSALTDP